MEYLKVANLKVNQIVKIRSVKSIDLYGNLIKNDFSSILEIP